MTDPMEWRGAVGRNWAIEWQRTDRSFADLTSHLLARIAAEPGQTIVDIGCGEGELSLAVAQVRPSAQITGVDISSDLLDAARQRAATTPNATFTQADAAQWTNPAGPPDLYISRHGVMFFTDLPAAFAHLAKSAAPGARMVFSCFRSPAENAWASAIAALLPPVPASTDRFQPGPFAFANPDHISRVMAPAWTDIICEPVDFSYVAGAGVDPVEDAMAFFARIGPTAFAIRTLPEPDRVAFESHLRAVLETHREGDKVTFDAAAWVVTATVDHIER